MNNISYIRARESQWLYITWAWNSSDGMRGMQVIDASAWVKIIHTTLDEWTELGYHPRVSVAPRITQ